jgi:PQQ-dependent dehydrogenase (methanol/ethanol family)
MSLRKHRAFVTLSVVGLFAMSWIATGLQNRRIDENALRDAGKNGEEWLTYGRDMAETRYSPLKQIDTTNVSRLGLAWTYEIGPGGGNQEGTLLMANGVVYGITNWSIVYALDARTGKELWRYDPKVDQPTIRPRICCGVVNRGIAIYDGKIFVPVIDGRLVALDAAKGTEVWNVQTTPTDQPYTMTMAPRIAKNKVIVGNAGAEKPVRGFFSAYDTATGELKWRFYTVPGDPSKPFENKAMEMAAKTWAGEWWKMGGGATVWDSITYDPDTNLVMVGTGNGGPWPEELRQSKGLDNLFVASVVAVDADSGEYKWHYQFVPGDSWDFDSVQQLSVADVRINGVVRKVVMQANKNGFFYVIDRTNGKLISADPYAQINWASEVDLRTGRPITRPEAFYGKDQTVMIMPGPGGAHNWAPMSFNPNTGLMYIPSTASSSSQYAVAQNFVYTPGNASNTGIARGNRGGGGGAGAAPPANPNAIQDPGAAIGAGQAPPPPPIAPAAAPLPIIGPQYTGAWLVAWDVANHKELWRAQGGGSIGGGTVVTAGNLVLQSLGNGRLRALTADKGEQLMEIATGQSGGMGPPITFMLDNKQYIAVAGGQGQNQGGRGGGGGGGNSAPPANPVLPRVYVYTLDGNTPNPTPVQEAATTQAPAPAGGRGQ